MQGEDSTVRRVSERRHPGGWPDGILLCGPVAAGSRPLEFGHYGRAQFVPRWCPVTVSCDGVLRWCPAMVSKEDSRGAAQST